MKGHFVAAGLGACVGVAACAPASAGSDRLRVRSAFDLNCPKEALQIQRIDDRTMGVVGCGHRVTYVESCNSPKYYADSECTWIMNTAAQQAVRPVAPAYAAQPQPIQPPPQATAPALQGIPGPYTAQPAHPVQPAPGAQTYAYPQYQLPPPELEYRKGAPIPPGYQLEEYHPTGFIISGAVTLGTLYVMSFAAAVDQNFSSGYGWLAVPVVGPFGWLSARKAPTCAGLDSASIKSCQDDENSKNGLVLLDGLGQVAGSVLLITGLAVTRSHWVRIAGHEVIIAPKLASNAGSLNLIGQF